MQCGKWMEFYVKFSGVASRRSWLAPLKATWNSIQCHAGCMVCCPVSMLPRGNEGTSIGIRLVLYYERRMSVNTVAWKDGCLERLLPTA
jgi:hypothetical protein